MANKFLSASFLTSFCASALMGADREQRPVAGVVGGVAGTRQRHVDVAADEDVLASRAHVRDVEHGVPRQLTLHTHVEHVRHVRLIAGRKEEHGKARRRHYRRRERHRREARQPVADAPERCELIGRHQIDLLEQRMVALERPAVGAEVVSVITDPIRTPDGGTAIVGRPGDAEPWCPPSIEIGRQRSAVLF